jgi:hypothetical protein
VAIRIALSSLLTLALPQSVRADTSPPCPVWPRLVSCDESCQSLGSDRVGEEPHGAVGPRETSTSPYVGSTIGTQELAVAEDKFQVAVREDAGKAGGVES